MDEKTIQVLPAHIAERIAAGEVVESPASVIKELVENALDAGASRIDVTSDGDGLALLGVSDNGSGMRQENLVKCLQRHATSKIAQLEDLSALSTMGFRGEALASVAAVSRLEVVSSAVEDGSAWCLRSNGGEVEPLHPSSRSRGTTVRVRDLFYNTPARKKFMKSGRSERMGIVRAVEQLAIPFPSIHFTLTLDGKPVFELPPAGDEIGRIAQVAGTAFARALVPCRGAFDATEALVYLSRPDEARPRPRYQCLYVNLRRIDNDSVHHAIRTACRDFISGALRPSFFCFISIDPHRIDVNIHPTKQKLKFDDESRLFGCLSTLVRKGVREHISPVNDLPPLRPPSARSCDLGPVSYQPQHREPHHWAPTSPVIEGGEQVTLHFPSVRELAGEEKSDGTSEEQTVQLLENDEGEHWSLISCFQIHGLYILAPIKNGVLLIDQHAAHERILFEQAVDDLERGGAASQQLLFPLTVELTAAQKGLIEHGRTFFSAFGYEVDDFGAGTISVSAIPAFLKDSQAIDAIREMLEFLLDGESMKSFPEQHRRFAAAFACGSAIKGGQELSSEEMNALLNALFATRNPYTCPHGRPTLVRLSMAELRRRFLR